MLWWYYCYMYSHSFNKTWHKQFINHMKNTPTSTISIFLNHYSFSWNIRAAAAATSRFTLCFSLLLVRWRNRFMASAGGGSHGRAGALVTLAIHSLIFVDKHDATTRVLDTRRDVRSLTLRRWLTRHTHNWDDVCVYASADSISQQNESMPSTYLDHSGIVGEEHALSQIWGAAIATLVEGRVREWVLGVHKIHT